MKSLKINNLEKECLSKKEMSILKGGVTCMCGCKYAGMPGGSLLAENGMANAEHGYHSIDIPIEDQEPFLKPAINE